MKSTLTIFLILLFSAYVNAENIVKVEHIKKDWKFSSIMRPSQSDAGANAIIKVVGNKPIASCVSLKGLTNGVMPRECRLLRDFFCFTNENSLGGKLIFDLKQNTPVSMINSYSAHGPVGGTTWCEEFDGSRGPQVYTVYGSSISNPDFENLQSKEWEHIADVDTRPAADADWVGQYGVNIQGENGELLGNFRWIAFDIKSTFKKGADNPLWTDTWYSEFDIHTPETQKKGGDFIFSGSQLDEMIVVYKTHFDIGFTHPAPEIVNTYRTEMIDKALKVIEESNSWPEEKRFSWTIPSWVAYQILWEGQDSVRLAKIVDAIKTGRLVVHGLPVTVHTESLDLEDVVFSLAFNKEVSRKMGIPMSRSGKMTDVPSHSWIWPTVLKHAGIDFLHIGVNPVNERPDVPLLYKWEGPDGSQLLTMHSQGYGSDVEFGHGIYPPVDWPFRHWLAMIVSTDNSGPPQMKEVEALLNEIHTNMPNVKVRFGKMEDFADAILDEEREGKQIPVVRMDMPDCWIHGVGTMPVMDSLSHSTRSRLVTAKMLDSNLRMWGMKRADVRKDLFNAQERSLMFGEHTWGGSRNLEGYDAYHKEDFEQFIKTDERCKWLTSTWKDHADYILKSDSITRGLIQEEMTELALSVSAKDGQLLVYNPLPWKRDLLVEIPNTGGRRFWAKNVPASGYRCYSVPSEKKISSEICDKAVIENKFFKFTLDRTKGGIISVINKKTKKEMVDRNAPYAFGTYMYERFDSIQNLQYHLGCSHLNTVYGYNGRGCRGWNVRKDLPSSPSYQCAVAEYDVMEVRKVSEGTEVVLKSLSKGIIRSDVKTVVFIPEHFPWFDISVSLIDKKPDYWPEAGSIYLPVNASRPQFRLGRLGSIVDPVTDFAKGSNRTYGCLNNGAMIADADGKGVGLYPLDNSLMSFGEKGMCSIDPEYIPESSLAKVCMFNTIWTINFPYWIQGNLTSRVRVWGVDSLDEENLVIPATEAKTNAEVVRIVKESSSVRKLPSCLEGIKLSSKGFRITSFGANPDGSGDLLRLWNTLSLDQNVTVYLPPKTTFTEAVPVNLRGEQIGDPYLIMGGKWSFCAKGYTPYSFVLR